MYIAPPGGEKITDVINRTGEFWRELTENPKYSDSRILVSTHGCALKAMLANIRRLEIKEFWGEGVHKNCAVTIVNVSEGKQQFWSKEKYFTDKRQKIWKTTWREFPVVLLYGNIM